MEEEAAPSRGKRRRAPTSSKRGPGFSSEELAALLRLLESVLPASKHEWDRVARHHEANGFAGRTPDSLRRKFLKLVRMPSGEGDARVPPTVKRAKRISHSIGEKAKFGGADDDDAAAEPLTEADSAIGHGNGSGESEDDQSDALPFFESHATTPAPLMGVPTQPHREGDLTRLVQRVLAQAEQDRRERAQERRQWQHDMRQRDAMVRAVLTALTSPTDPAASTPPPQSQPARADDQLTRLVQTTLMQAEQDRRERAEERRQWQQDMRQRDDMMRATLTALTVTISQVIQANTNGESMDEH